MFFLRKYGRSGTSDLLQTTRNICAIISNGQFSRKHCVVEQLFFLRFLMCISCVFLLGYVCVSVNTCRFTQVVDKQLRYYLNAKIRITSACQTMAWDNQHLLLIPPTPVNQVWSQIRQFRKQMVPSD